MAERDRGLEARLAQPGPIPLDASLACAGGEVLALVGPSGGGKTTILRAIAGLYRPRDGRVRCAGETWLDTARGVSLSPQQRAVGFVFQDYALFPHLSVAGNVESALGHVARNERRARASALLERVNLAGLDRRRPAALSGGQQQRVAIARALARDPAVLLLDEPFSAVDQVTRRKLRRELAALRRDLPVPVVLVTHDLDEAGMLADRMCILHHGKTLQHGAPAEVTARPESAEVARLVDLPNLFEGVVEAHRDEPPATLVRWLDYTLEARRQPRFAPGERVCWVIPSAAVLLHRRDRPSRGERENPVAGTIDSFVPLGESASIGVRVDGGDGLRLTLSVPVHVAARNRLAERGPLRVSLLAEAIHLMPWTDLGRPELDGPGR